MSKKDKFRINEYLEHILSALDRIFEYVDDVDESTFLKNTLIQDAVLRNLEIMGEASRNLVRYHQDFIEKHSSVPWEDIYWMRNRISHGYFSVDLEIIWNTIERDLPGLKEKITSIHNNHPLNS